MTGTPIDSSRPYRWPSELVELVEAVTATDPHNESTWIEWKSTLDLNDKSGHYHVAKHVLGFANRTVATARVHTGGYAYLLVGAQPGDVQGIEAIDPAVLRPKIIRYVGPAVRWRAEYVGVKDRHVLVVVVEPPEPGDPIYPVRYQLDGHSKGRVLVRRPGATEVADDFEIDQLVQRVRVGEGGLEIDIQPLTSTIEALPAAPDVPALAEAERTATLDRPRFGEPRPTTNDPSGFALAEAFQRQLAAVTQSMSTADRRSLEEYEGQVEKHARAYGAALQRRWLWRLWRHQPICLQLEALNLTDANFADIEIQIHIGGAVRSWPAELDKARKGDEPVLPERPAVLGTPNKTSFGLPIDPSILLGPRTPMYRPPTAIGRGPNVTVRDTGSVTIDIAGVDLRPEERQRLPIVRLFVDAEPGVVLRCEWTATASNVPRRLSGSFALTVAAATFSADAAEPGLPNAEAS